MTAGTHPPQLVPAQVPDLTSPSVWHPSATARRIVPTDTALQLHSSARVGQLTLIGRSHR